MIEMGETMDRGVAVRWVDHLFTAWRNADPDAAASLFTPEAVYRSHPFGDPRVGREAIGEYWRAAVARQSDLDLHVGTPVVDGDRVAVEWWASLTEDGIDSVSTGSLFLAFEDGRCASLREVWMERAGRRRPYQGWGS